MSQHTHTQNKNNPLERTKLQKTVMTTLCPEAAQAGAGLLGNDPTHG